MTAVGQSLPSLPGLLNNRMQAQNTWLLFPMDHGQLHYQMPLSVVYLSK